MQCKCFSVNPLVLVFEKFLSENACEKIRQLATDLKQAKVLAQKQEEASTARVAFTQKLNPEKDHQLFYYINTFRKVLNDVTCKQCTFIRYEKGGHYKPHYDAFPWSKDKLHYALTEYGQRFFSTLLYLNDDFQGGTTVFPHLGIEIAPHQGDVLCWSDVELGTGTPEKKSLHAGQVVTRGQKDVVAAWWNKRIDYMFE